MSAFLITPTELIKGVKLLRTWSNATRNDEHGSIARFHEFEEYLARFKEAITSYQNNDTKDTIPDHVLAALKACETAAWMVDLQLEGFREVFNDGNVRRRRMKGLVEKIRFASAFGGIMKGFEERTGRELVLVDVWWKMMEGERLRRIDRKVEELNCRVVAVGGFRRITPVDASTCLENEEEGVRLCGDELQAQDHSEGRLTPENMGLILQNERMGKIERTTRIERNTLQRDQHTQHSDEILDAGSGIGTALGHIVRGLIGLMDTACVQSFLIPTWDNNLSIEGLQSKGIQINKAYPYKNRITKPLSLRVHACNLVSLTTPIVLFRPQYKEPYVPEDDDTKWTDVVSAYTACRDINGVWLTDTFRKDSYIPVSVYMEYRTLLWKSDTGAIVIGFKPDKETSILLRFSGTDFAKRAANSLKRLHKFRRKPTESLPGCWPDTTSQKNALNLPPDLLTKEGLRNLFTPGDGWTAYEEKSGRIPTLYSQTVACYKRIEKYFITYGAGKVRMPVDSYEYRKTSEAGKDSESFVRHYDSDGNVMHLKEFLCETFDTLRPSEDASENRTFTRLAPPLKIVLEECPCRDCENGKAPLIQESTEVQAALHPTQTNCFNLLQNAPEIKQSKQVPSG